MVLAFGIGLNETFVWHDDIDSHVQDLLLVLEKLYSRNVEPKCSKCRFGQSSMKFCGHIVDSQGISIDLVYNWCDFRP